MGILATQEQAIVSSGSESTRQCSFPAGITAKERGDMPNGLINRNRDSVIFDQNKPLPTITVNQQQHFQSRQHSQPPSQPSARPEAQPILEHPQQQQQPQKKPRRSFMPTALMTSNLAKFVSGSRNNSPTTAVVQSNSPRSPRSPLVLAPKPVEQKEEEPALVPGAALTIEQFKWTIICCCNEIKSRVNKQRHELSKGAQTPPSPNPEVAASEPAQQRKPERPKVGRFNGYSYSSSSTTIEIPPKDPRSTLQPLLQVMALSVEETTGPRDGRRDVSAYAQDSSSASFYHGSPSQTQNQSLLSLMTVGAGNGSVGGDSALPKRTLSSNQPSHYSASFHSLAPSLVSSNASSPSYISTSSAAAYQQQQQRQQQQRQQQPARLRSKKSQSKLAVSQATDALLNPLSLEDLVGLFAYILSVAPEQWIPWHLYDFFIRPQGRRYRDLVELLPTQSQRILKSILETVDGLVDYGVMVTLAQRQLALTSSKAGTLASGTGLASQTTGGALGSSLAVNGIRQQLSQVHLRSRSEACVTIKSDAETSAKSLVMALTAQDPVLTQVPVGPYDDGTGDTVHVEAAVRTRKRRVIVDGLASLVFRSRQDVSTSFYGTVPASVDRDSMLRQTMDAAAADERTKSKRRYSSAAYSAGAGFGPTATTLGMNVQTAEREREAGLKAFENLVLAFEEEYHPQKNAIFSRMMMTNRSVVSAAATESVMSTRPASMPTAMHVVANPLGQAGPPRQARSLPSPIASPATELATVRSLSLPPWRKPAAGGSQIHLGQNQQNNRSHLSITESPAEPSSKGTRPPLPSKPPITAPTAMENGSGAIQHHSSDQVSVGAVIRTDSTQSTNAPSPTTSGKEDDAGAQLNSAPARTSPTSGPTAPAAPAPRPDPIHIPGSFARSNSNVSATLSATWSAWKDHLLVLEEEEYVIVDTSDSEPEDRSASASLWKSNGHASNGHLNESRSRDRDTFGKDIADMDFNDVTTGAGIMARLMNEARRKKSRAFGDLQRLAAAMEADNPDATKEDAPQATNGGGA
ncbi:hypothetical protein BGZ54_008169 [Gamsiella multidivaricata]|nr:hypothetical protein BGZ54_008169 [Gamsiella multidivaricata]